jgi:hypothetical protein
MPRPTDHEPRRDEKGRRDPSAPKRPPQRQMGDERRSDIAPGPQQLH